MFLEVAAQAGLHVAIRAYSAKFVRAAFLMTRILDTLIA